MMRTARNPLLFLALGVLAACNKPAPQAEPTEAATPAPTASPEPAADASPTKMAFTGVLSEDEFKKLHELSTADAPAPRGETIELAGAKAYLSLPAGEGPFPGVIVIHEWWGLNDHIRHWSDRLAAAGYAALAVDLYGGKVATTPDEATTYVKTVDEARAKEILTAANDFLGEDPRVKAPHRGVIGWCFGGGWSLQAAIELPDLDAAIIYYGRLETDPKVLASIHADVLGIFGNHDKGIPPASVDAFEAAMKKAGKTLEVHRYDANHAFANPSSARYDHEHATQAWAEVQEFLAAHLQG